MSGTGGRREVELTGRSWRWRLGFEQEERVGKDVVGQVEFCLDLGQVTPDLLGSFGSEENKTFI